MDRKAFPHAVAAGLPMLGGEDIHVTVAGVSVRGHFWKADGNRLPVLISPGFTEFCEKYSPVAARLHARGHSVLIIDWPGQGRSGHLAKHEFGVHIDSFAQHLAAMDALVDAAGLNHGKLIIFGHSMGGHLALRLASRYSDRVAGAVAISPMMVPRPRPVWLIRLVARLLILAGRSRHNTPATNPERFQDERVFSQDNHLTRSERGYQQRFSWYEDAPEMWRYGATVGWVAAAYASCAATTLNPAFLRSISCPVLTLTGGDETIVRRQAFEDMLPWLPDRRHHEYDGAKHELLYETDEVRADLWWRVEAFLDEIDNG